MTEPPALMSVPDEGVSGLWLWQGAPPDQQKGQRIPRRGALWLSIGAPLIVAALSTLAAFVLIVPRLPDCTETSGARHTLGLIPGHGGDRYAKLAAACGRHAGFASGYGRYSSGGSRGSQHPRFGAFGAGLGRYSWWNAGGANCAGSSRRAGAIASLHIRPSGCVVATIASGRSKAWGGSAPR